MVGILAVFDADVSLTLVINTVVRTEGQERAEYGMAGKMCGGDRVLPALQTLRRLPSRSLPHVLIPWALVTPVRTTRWSPCSTSVEHSANIVAGAPVLLGGG